MLSRRRGTPLPPKVKVETRWFHGRFSTDGTFFHSGPRAPTRRRPTLTKGGRGTNSSCVMWNVVLIFANTGKQKRRVFKGILFCRGVGATPSITTNKSLRPLTPKLRPCTFCAQRLLAFMVRSTETVQRPSQRPLQRLLVLMG